jgi:5-methylcytosine-specific restriction enzyme subunit McrC
VGLVAIPELQLVIEPKIPRSHLLYLMEQTGALPRMDHSIASGAADQPLWRLVALWFLNELERLMRGDLAKDYHERNDTLKLIRGQVDTARVAHDFYTGRLEFSCRFEEHNQDTPLNRILKAAARVIAASPQLPTPDRHRALRTLHRMTDIGEPVHGDLRAVPTRTTARYRNPWLLARHVIDATGRQLKAGNDLAWSFLFYTPILAESGIRAVLRQHLGDRVHPTARKRQLEGTTHMTVNPDLVFDQGDRVGDVKYKLTDTAWPRSDLYQLTTFAAAYETAEALRIAFSPDRRTPEPVKVGKHRLTALSWNTATNNPTDAATQLAADVSEWLTAPTSSTNIEKLPRVAS